jgi:hypothetical protein
MNISETCIRRPVLTTLMTASLIVFGIFAYRLLPVAALPASSAYNARPTTFEEKFKLKFMLTGLVPERESPYAVAWVFVSAQREKKGMPSLSASRMFCRCAMPAVIARFKSYVLIDTFEAAVGVAIAGEAPAAEPLALLESDMLFEAVDELADIVRRCSKLSNAARQPEARFIVIARCRGLSRHPDFPLTFKARRPSASQPMK